MTKTNQRSAAPGQRAEPATLSTLSAEAILSVVPLLRAYAMSRLRSAARADDAVQDALERAWKARASFIVGSSLDAWMIAILRNQIVDSYRKERRLVNDVDGAFAARLAAPPAQELRIELRELLALVEKLKPEAQEALLLVGLGITDLEGAAIMGVPPGTFKSHVRRARAKLNAMLGEKEL